VTARPERVDRDVRLPLRPGLTIRVGEHVVESDTRVATAGANIVTISTAVSRLAVELHSTYIGHAGAQTAATELVLAPRRPALTRVRHPAPASVDRARRACLCDHALRLLELLAELVSAPVAMDLPDDAVAHFDGARR
jgi:hypothetical protein